jgi:hypothetical protein
MALASTTRSRRRQSNGAVAEAAAAAIPDDQINPSIDESSMTNEEHLAQLKKQVRFYK